MHPTVMGKFEIKKVLINYRKIINEKFNYTYNFDNFPFFGIKFYVTDIWIESRFALINYANKRG